MTDFAELVAATNYSFLRGASHPSDMVAQAIALGHTGIGIADRNTVAGVVRAWAALNEAPDKRRVRMLAEKAAQGDTEALTPEEWAGCAIDLRLVVGARLVFSDVRFANFGLASLKTQPCAFGPRYNSKA